MKMQYVPANDELILINHPVAWNPSKEVDHFKLWWDDEGNIYALAITDYTEEMEEFRGNSSITQLGNIWRGISITEEDIRKAREDLLETLEEKW